MLAEAKKLLELHDAGALGWEYSKEVSDTISELRREIKHYEVDNAVIVRYQGLEQVYELADSPHEQEQEGDFEGRVPLWVRQKGILWALRAALEVPELESILMVAIRRMKELKRLRSSRNEPFGPDVERLQPAQEAPTQPQLIPLGGQDRGEQ